MNLPNPAGARYSFASKFLLALASIASYALISSLAEAVEPIDSIPEPGLWFPYLAGAIFGAFVLMPYVGANRRILRIAVLCVASALIYRGAVWLVTAGPLEADLLVTFVLTGSAAAALCALAVGLIAPQPCRLRALAFALIAGAAGGASFEFKIPSDPYLLVSHGAWQLLACLALHAGFRQRATA